MTSRYTIMLDNDHRTNGHPDVMVDCPRCRAEAEELGMADLLPERQHAYACWVPRAGDDHCPKYCDCWCHDPVEVIEQAGFPMGFTAEDDQP